MEAAEQTKNFLSFIFRLSAGGEGGAGKNCKEIFGFATRESASASEARSSAIGAYFAGSKPPRTRSVRNQPLRGWKWVRAKVSMSAQIETSRSDRAAPQSGAAWAGGKNARREATNSDGAGTEKRADLSLFRIP